MLCRLCHDYLCPIVKFCVECNDRIHFFDSSFFLLKLTVYLVEQGFHQFKIHMTEIVIKFVMHQITINTGCHCTIICLICGGHFHYIYI